MEHRFFMLLIIGSATWLNSPQGSSPLLAALVKPQRPSCILQFAWSDTHRHGHEVLSHALAYLFTVITSGPEFSCPKSMVRSNCEDACDNRKLSDTWSGFYQ